MTTPDPLSPRPRRSREQRRLRFRRRRRRAYIRSVYFLPSMATLGNAICGFAAMYVSTLDPTQHDPITRTIAHYRFLVAAYLIFMSMLFDALDGRLARFTRHTTDFGGQLDSLADVLSFGAAPAFLALQVFKIDGPQSAPLFLTRLVWAIGALFLSCAAIRLARFNVSNEHGEQHHFSFLGLPSPGEAAPVASFILMEQHLLIHGLTTLAFLCACILPIVVLLAGLLMVSSYRYPHIVNRYLRGKRSIARLMAAVILGLLFIVAHQYVLALGTLAYVLFTPLQHILSKSRRKSPAASTPI